MVIEGKTELIILIVEDDPGHASLIMKNLKRSGLTNKFIVLKDGKEALDFLFQFLRGKDTGRRKGDAYLLLLDIRMPKVDGIEVLRQIKQDPDLREIPVIMLTTTDDPREIETCYKLGCNVYITKPVDSKQFVEAITKLGLFLTVVKIPKIDGKS